MEDSMSEVRYALLIPFYNEEAQVRITADTVHKIMSSLDGSFEILFIDDGSKDRTWDEIEIVSQRYPEVRAIRFSRNFGKEAAICAAMKECSADAVILIDGDLQHPPELIPQMVELWKQGYEVVEAKKNDRGKESIFSRFAANSFYKLFAGTGDINLKNASDFKLLDKKVVEAFNQFSERGTFFRGLSAWLGFKRKEVLFEVAERQTGISKWNLSRKIRLSIDAISAFSSKPLELILLLGIVFVVLGMILALQTLIKFCLGHAAIGFTTVILLELIIGGLILLSLGIIGIYISRIYDEVKARPRYIISERILPKSDRTDSSN